jgi:hippurate hydrolase
LNQILRKSKDIENEIIEYRRFFHQHPEIGFDLPQTLQRVKEILMEFGIQPEIIGKSGISVILGKPGKTFLIRGDMDALPLHEDTDLPYKSVNGSMHACGHDIHTSALLGAVKILKENEAELEGTVKFMFQPAEETLFGARDMIEHGILENPKVDAAMALHVVNKPSGTVGCAKGFACASSDVFKIVITGKGSHGAASYMGVDPINVAAHLHLALQALNSRETHPDDMVVITIGRISAGSAPNIIPETAELEGTIRTMNPQTRAFMKKRLIEIAESVSATFRASCEIHFHGDGVPPMFNNEILATEVMGYIDDLLGEGTAYDMPRMTGSEDFARVSEIVPSVILWVGTGSKEEGYPYGVHHPKVTFNEDVIHKISAIYAECALRWLQVHQD